MPTTVSYRTLDLADVGVPVIELAGAQDGPRLVVLAGVHGCEYAPMAAVRRWTRELGDRELRGRVTAVPVLNLPAFRSRTPFVTPGRRQEPQPVLPGRPVRHVHRPAGGRGVPAAHHRRGRAGRRARR